MAKALALGANLVAIGLPFLRWASQSQKKIINGVNNLKKELQVAMWYTGSSNIAELMRQPEIDGALVGGASLKADDFLSIAKQASELRGLA